MTEKESVEELDRVLTEGRDLLGMRQTKLHNQTNLTIDRRATTKKSDSGVFHSLCSGAVCESCVGRTQTCGMPTQSLALRMDCLLKPRGLGFIAGAPPEETL